MIRDKSFFSDLKSKMEKKACHANLVKTAANDLHERFEIPVGLLTDYMTLRVPADDASDFILYALCTVYFDTDKINEIFSAKEVKSYSKTKYKEEKLKFPLEFRMVQINSTQWIGKIQAKDLMAFRDAQIINYNERTQRTLERKIAHGYEYWQIAINDVAVREIEKSYESDAYIPNTITLNIGDASQADFEYDEEQGILRINKIAYFDILDGYHRYRAISKEYIKNPKFDYPMELRIVNFSEEHARQFIWQEDQKTKMSKVDSDSYNQNDYSVYICERIASALPSGIISRNRGAIDFAELSLAIKYFYHTQQMKRSQVLNIANNISRQMLYIIQDIPDIIDSKWTRQEIYCFICLCSNNDKDITKRLGYLCRDSERDEQIWSGAFSQRKATALQKIYEKLK